MLGGCLDCSESHGLDASRIAAYLRPTHLDKAHAAKAGAAKPGVLATSTMLHG
jgi:hypothetical protein